MWKGWVSYGGNEILNVHRTEAYARQAQLRWFKPVYKNTSLAAMLGDGDDYTTPLADNAPWTDPDSPDSYRFYGVYPLDINGIEDSSRSSTVTESVRDGGNPGRLRHGTKTIVFSVVLIGEDDAAVSYGFRWLKQTLLAGPCGSDIDCTGTELCYLDSEPQVDLDAVETTIVSGPAVSQIDLDGSAPSSGAGTVYDGGAASDDNVVTTDYDGSGPTITGNPVPVIVTSATSAEDCLDPLLRSLRKVVFNSGPSVTSQRTTTDGSAVWTATFTGVAGEPWEYGGEVEVIEGFLDPAVDIPWAGGVVPEGGFVDLDGQIVNEAECVVKVYSPLQDPLFPSVIPPPPPPSVPLGGYSPPANWRRRQITIPANYIPLWGEVVPKFSIHARTAEVRNLRLRFYADVDGDGDITDDPCAFCGDIVVSYIPEGSTLTFDTSERQVYVVDASQRRRSASAVVFATDGTPFEWPVLSCGMGYIVTLDLPQTQHAPVFDLSLFSRVA